MLTLIFVFLLLSVCGKLTIFALKATWGITKFILSVVFFPVTMILLAVSGCIAIAIPILIVAGILLIVKSAAVL